MLINKITTGFVIQQFDTEKKVYVSQYFTAGDVEYEDRFGEPVDSSLMAVNPDGSEPYLPFDMLQPDNAFTTSKLSS